MADQASRPARIVRATKNADNPYFVMCRKPAQDAKLSWAARGVLVYLLSKPDDWSVEPKDLQQGCGRDKVYAILKELESAGYLTQVAVRNDKQQFVSWEYQLHELPVEPLPEKPYTAKPDTAEPHTANPPSTYKREEQNTDPTEDLPGAALPGSDEEKVIDEKCKQCGRLALHLVDGLCSSCKRFGPYVQMDGWKALGRVFDKIPNPHIGKSRHGFFVVDRERKCVFLPKFSRRTDADNSELWRSPEIKRVGVDSWDVLTSACGEYTILERIKPPKPAKALAYSSSLIFDALAAALFDATDPADKTAVGGRVGPIREKLIDHVLAKRKAPDLDDVALKELDGHIRKFPAWYRESCPGCDLPQHPNSFMPKWIDYVKSGGKVVPKPGAPQPEKQMAVVNGKVVWT